MKTPSNQINQATGVRVTYERLVNGDVKTISWSPKGEKMEQGVMSIQDARHLAASDRKHGFKAIRQRGNVMATAFGPSTPSLS